MLVKTAASKRAAPRRAHVLLPSLENGLAMSVGALGRTRGDSVNWDTIEGNWKQLKGKLKQKWGELTDDDLDRIGGKKDELVGKLQERKGIARDQAEREVQEWSRNLDT